MFIVSTKGVYCRTGVKLSGAKFCYFDRLCGYQFAVSVLREHEAAEYTACSNSWSRVYLTFGKIMKNWSMAKKHGDASFLVELPCRVKRSKRCHKFSERYDVTIKWSGVAEVRRLVRTNLSQSRFSYAHRRTHPIATCYDLPQACSQRVILLSRI